MSIFKENKNIEEETIDNIEDNCDLNPSKMCDSCGKCLEMDDNDYMEISIDGVIKEEDEVLKEYEDFSIYHEVEDDDESIAPDYEFIEDIEGVRDEYYEKLEEILYKKGEK